MVGRKLFQFEGESKRKLLFSSICFLVSVENLRVACGKGAEGKVSAFGQSRGAVPHTQEEPQHSSGEIAKVDVRKLPIRPFGHRIEVSNQCEEHRRTGKPGDDPRGLAVRSRVKFDLDF